MKIRKIGLFLVLVVSMIFLVPVQPAKAWFIGYASPDGNAIDRIDLNRDGVFNGTVYYNPDSYMDNDTAIVPIGIEIGDNISLAVFVWLNGTVAGISSNEEGMTVIRHSIVVSTATNASVWSQQNFTHIVDGGEAWAPMYFYRYDVILDFTFVAATTYTVVVTYEIWH